MTGQGSQLIAKKFELNYTGDRDMEVSTSVMVDGVADCLNGLSGLYNEMEVKEPSISTILMNFENKFDPYNAMSTPLYQTATFKQTRKVGRVARAICITSHPIPNTLESHSVQVILPQKQLGCKSDMYLFCCSYSHNVDPKGKFIAFASTEVESDQPKIELKSGIDLLGPVDEIFFDIYDRYKPINEPSLDNCFISTSYDATTHFESTVTDVLNMYTMITGKVLDLSVDLSAASAAEE